MPIGGTCKHEITIFSTCSINSYSVRKNLVLESIQDAVSEVKRFRQAGGGTICDVTTVGIRCKPEALPQISRESGVNVVMGTGYYVDSYLSEDTKLMTSLEVRWAWLLTDLKFCCRWLTIWLER